MLLTVVPGKAGPSRPAIRHPLGGVNVEAVVRLFVIRTVGDHRKRSGTELLAIDDGDALAIRQDACDVRRWRRAVKICRTQKITLPLMLLMHLPPEVCELAVRIIRADGKVPQQLRLDPADELVGLRRLHVVVEARAPGVGVGIVRVDVPVGAVRTAGEVNFVPLDGLVAVLVRPVEVQASRVAERIAGAHDVAAELIDVAVVRSAQKRLVTELERGTDTG